MNKSETIKRAVQTTRNKNRKNVLKNIILFPVNLCKKVWNWLRNIDVVGMVNLTLLVAIIVLFSCLISNITCYRHGAFANETPNIVVNKNQNVNVAKKITPAKSVQNDMRKVIKRHHKINAALPARVDSETKLKPQIQVVGVKKPIVVRELSLPASELPKQVLAGDVIIERHPASPILSNGVVINGNLFIQNMRKYTLPCDAEISGHLFVRNVENLKFCGKFVVRGNIYVTRKSSFGAIPGDAKIGGQIVL